MKNYLFILALTTLAPCGVGVYAQSIQGTVVDDAAAPLPYAIIQVEETDRYTITDADGRYTISASPGDKLIFSCIGFDTEERIVSETGRRMDVALSLSDVYFYNPVNVAIYRRCLNTEKHDESPDTYRGYPYGDYWFFRQIPKDSLQYLTARDSIYTSNIRQGEELSVGKIYTDNFEFLDYRDGGDDLWIDVIKDGKVYSIIANRLWEVIVEEKQFQTGDPLTMDWKIDFMVPAGDNSVIMVVKFAEKITKRTNTDSIAHGQGEMKQAADTIPPDGTYRFDIAFAEWEGKSMGEKVTVIISGDSIRVIYEGDGTMGEKGEMDNGKIMKHKSGVWIISDDPSDTQLDEVGGCTGGPTVIDFKNKKYEIC